MRDIRPPLTGVSAATLSRDSERVELLCFDLDGTLVDSAPDLNYALGEALEAVGLQPPTEAQTRSWIGHGIDRLLARALESADSRDRETFAAALRAFHASYSQNLFNRSRLYPGVEAVLESLRASGRRICCITNKRTDYAIALLAQTGISDMFEFTFGGDSFAEKKPHPRQLLEATRRAQVAATRCVMIGDSDTDSAAAKAAGFAFVWAAFGYCGELRSRDNRAIARADSFSAIPATLGSLLL
ncbi:MAG: phosphoglycolate phosphatase [Gammaproteobacteria bacterium]|jgi:phosphoglycolate phosphatase